MARFSDDGREWEFVPTGVGLAPTMIKVIDTLAQEEQRSRSQMIRVLLSEALDARMRKAAKEPQE